MTITGHPQLTAAIVSEIASSGPMPFVRFMEFALYHPQYGYYMRPPETGTERIGWSGDFYTSSDVHPILGQALARQAEQIDALLGHPAPFTVVEMGPGKGLLAAHFLSACLTGGAGTLPQRLRYVMVERSPAMRAVQQQHLQPWSGRDGLVTWLEGIESLPHDGTVGLMFSNELIDAFPVHRVQVSGGVLKELFVDYRDGRFVECLRPLSDPALAAYMARLDLVLPEGYRTEINLRARDWMVRVAGSLSRGAVLTIDYGHSAQDLYGPDRAQGTLLCYRSQLTSEDPYTWVGLQDMTSHVDFTSLALAGQEAGLSLTGFTNQMSFLMGLGVEEMIGRLEPESPEFFAALHLLQPNGMGRTFKILVQHKAMVEPQFDGLAFKPFFGSALTATGHHRREVPVCAETIGMRQ
ncbi:MAG TPA: SAM-dependent methyltransferase [Nitrospira sp.]|mgnify:CR=1 FL=1|nr:SAM-dependent methyltransferase [Nitrospira sp.]